MKSTIMPVQRRGKSKQDYETPECFFKIVEKYFGVKFDIDLAANEHNTKCKIFFNEQQDSLKQNWNCYKNCWLNPPYNNISHWVRKAFLSCSTDIQIFILVPASVGSNWFRDYVYQKCDVIFLNGRITFVDEYDPYPKDLMLLRYGNTTYKGNFYIWDWKQFVQSNEL